MTSWQEKKKKESLNCELSVFPALTKLTEGQFPGKVKDWNSKEKDVQLEQPMDFHLHDQK